MFLAELACIGLCQRAPGRFQVEVPGFNLLLIILSYAALFGLVALVVGLAVTAFGRARWCSSPA
jgi:cytochrome bd-type quinol oxidase subunit 1